MIHFPLVEHTAIYKVILPYSDLQLIEHLELIISLQEIRGEDHVNLHQQDKIGEIQTSCLCPPNLYVKALILNVIVVGPFGDNQV